MVSEFSAFNLLSCHHKSTSITKATTNIYRERKEFSPYSGAYWKSLAV